MTPCRLLLSVVALIACFSPGKVNAQQSAVQSSEMQQKLDQIILPAVHFQEATIEEALEYFRVKSRDLDTRSVQPAEKGVSFVFKKGSATTGKITLNLREVSLAISLKYSVELAGLKYRVEPYGIVVASSFEAAYSPAPVVGNADQIIFPLIHLSDVAMDEVAEYFRVKSHDLDPAKNGVNIIIKPGGSSAKISLNLINAPLSEALNYVALLSDHELSIDSNVYIFSPLKTP